MSQTTVRFKIQNLRAHDPGFKIRVFDPGTPETVQLMVWAPRQPKKYRTGRDNWQLSWDVFAWAGDETGPTVSGFEKFADRAALLEWSESVLMGRLGREVDGFERMRGARSDGSDGQRWLDEGRLFRAVVSMVDLICSDEWSR